MAILDVTKEQLRQLDGDSLREPVALPCEAEIQQAERTFEASSSSIQYGLSDWSNGVSTELTAIRDGGGSTPNSGGPMDERIGIRTWEGGAGLAISQQFPLHWNRLLSLFGVFRIGRVRDS